MSEERVSEEALLAELRELEEAARLIRERRFRSIYLNIGKLIVEVSDEEAIEYIERRMSALKSVLSRLRRRRSEG